MLVQMLRQFNNVTSDFLLYIQWFKCVTTDKGKIENKANFLRFEVKLILKRSITALLYYF